jgi:lysozyme family protein
VNVSDDGIIGSQTVATVCDQENYTNLVNTLAVKRENFYRNLKTFDTFGRGWLRRNDETRAEAVKMAENDV